MRSTLVKSLLNLSGIHAIILQVRTSACDTLQKVGIANLINKLLPGICVLCRFPSNTTLCEGCDADLPGIGEACSICGIPLDPLWAAVGQLSHESRCCGACIRNPPPFESTVAALQYSFPVTVLVQGFKFRRNFACGTVLAEKLVQAAQKNLDDGRRLPDLLVPVPLHRARQFLRVFNQAEVLAHELGKALEVPVAANRLRRNRRTHPQPGLTAIERRKNISGAFTARPMKATHVGLVDDVMTTGSTITECAKALRQVGVSSVSVWIAARAG